MTDVGDLLARVMGRLDSMGVPDGPYALGPGPLTAFRASRPTGADLQVYEPVFCLVLQGAKSIEAAGRALAFGRMQTLVVGVDLALSARITRASPAAPYVALSIRPDLALLRDLAAELPGEESEGAWFGATGADGMIVDAMGRLLGLLDAPRGRGVLEPLILREVHYWMLESAHGPLLRRLARADGPAQRIGRAVAAIRAGAARPLRVADLAREAGMSVSAFHAQFRAVTATTPIQFQKRLRLLAARRLLGAEGARVAAAAFAVGYESSTQFSRDYVRAFGRPPRADRGAMALAAE